MATAAARRYAKAVFELAQEDGSAAAWHNRLQYLAALVAMPEVRAALENRSAPAGQRAAVLESMGDALGTGGLNLGRLLIENGRIGQAADILAEFDRQVDEAEGRVRATVTAAVPVGDDVRQGLERDLAQRFGGQVRLDLEVDPAILGGLVLQVGDRVVDASVRTRLQQLRRRLATAT